MRGGHKRKTIEEYRSMIAVYEGRRIELRKKYGVGTDEYRKRVRLLSQRIGTFKKGIKRLIAIKERLHSVRKSIHEFMGVDVIETKFAGTKEQIQAKGIFFKYCMEHGISGKYPNDYIGNKSPHTASRIRKRFTLSFKVSKENKQLYHGFLKYMKRK